MVKQTGPEVRRSTRARAAAERAHPVNIQIQAELEDEPEDAVEDTVSLHGTDSENAISGQEQMSGTEDEDDEDDWSESDQATFSAADQASNSQQESNDANANTIYRFYFTKLGDKAQCNACKAKLSAPGSKTTTLTRHLQSKHSKLNREYEEKMKLKKKKIEKKNEKKVKRLQSTGVQPKINHAFAKFAKYPHDSERAKTLRKKLAFLNY